ncbi:RHS repeat-associated core domain-containing protein, partial [Micrococcus luteus]|nr:RHS repeat-associated core domain-containing protein [Micrococcus luteus]
RRYIYDGHLPVALIDYSDPNKTQIYYIHSDGSGQPFLVTDEHQQTVWLADNEAFGKSQPIIEKIEFNLRLPGQYYDAETGLHQNIYRNYDPELGHYLEP